MAKIKSIANIYGIIVDNFYDDDYFNDYIDKGIVTPASRFIFQVAAATGDLEVHVNSFGGDVFAANSMIIALRAWAASHPDANLDIIVESIALSAAANFIAMAPKSAKVHAYGPSLIMFHSCSTITFGGPGAHKDAANLMDKINGNVKAALKARTSLDQTDIDTWFQDDRQGWLSSDEAKKCKLIDDVLDGDPMPAPEKPSEKLEDKAIAAFYSGQQGLLAIHIKQQGDMTMPTAEEENNRNNEEKNNEETQQAAASEGEENNEEENNGNNGEENNEETQQNAQQRISQLEAEVANLKAQLADRDAKIGKLTAGFHSKAQAPATTTSFDEELAAMKGLPPAEWDAKFIALKKKDPEGFAQFMKRKSIH